MALTSSRRPTSAETGPTYSAAAVANRMRNSVALTQCNSRSPPVKRDGASRRSDGLVVATIRPSDPRVLVITALFPVAGLERGLHGDAVEPLARLVPVHRRHVEPHRTAVDV